MSYSIENPAHYSPHVTQELEKFLKPVIVLMKVLGFNLSCLPDHVPHRLQTRLVRLLGWIFLITNLLNCVSTLYILSIQLQVKRRSSTILWTLKITFINDMMFKLLNHLSLLITVGDTSKQLRLSKILQKLSFPGLKIRQLSVPVIIILLSDYLFTFVLGCYLISNDPNNSTGQKMGLIMYSGGSLFPMITILVYLIMSVLAIELYRQMRIEVQDIVSNSSTSSTKEMKFYLKRWKERYALLSQLIDWINQCFGFILLQSILYFYVGVINGTFYLILSISSQNQHYLVSTFYMIQIIKQMGYMVIISITPSKIKKEVVMIYKTLRQFEFNKSEIQQKINFLMIEVIESTPTISAHGLFDVDLKILPKLVGTMLTNLIIIYQFQMAEE